MNITLEQARVFVTVIDKGSFGKAAQELNKTHSSLVYSIKTLEQQMGLQLFDRSQYRSQPTVAGKRILAECRKLLSAEKDLQNLCQNLSTGWEPFIRIVYEGIFPFQGILKTIQKLSAKKVPTKFQIYSGFLQGVEKTFFEQEAHMMISILPPHKAGFESIKLQSLKSLLVAHKDHPLSKGKKTLRDLKEHRFLTVRGSDISLNLSTAILDADCDFQLNDFQTKKLAITEGVGFGWLPEYLIKSELKSGQLKIIQWNKPSKHEFTPHLYYLGEEKIGKAGKLFLEEFQWQQRSSPGLHLD